eukprot:CAMPEP_0184316008 /NCGR_PEP_ID=MMETSP1049-20130417/87254_1 /TAXON_ID=77928 /ORGANISM="Proteomonas sulcata, Strain CCMP704" /LENGTH=43 /DNA_ID= /DNA_START= /DNA_END= /DNA_ORIENTATION=
MGRNWSDNHAMGVASEEELAEGQQQTLLDDMHTFVQQPAIETG